MYNSSFLDVYLERAQTYMEDYNPKHKYYDIWEIVYDTLGQTAPDAILENSAHMTERGAEDVLKKQGEFVIEFSANKIDEHNISNSKICSALNDKLKRLNKNYTATCMKTRDDMPARKAYYQIVISDTSYKGE